MAQWLNSSIASAGLMSPLLHFSSNPLPVEWGGSGRQQKALGPCDHEGDVKEALVAAGE